MFLELTNHYLAHEYVTFVNCNVQKKKRPLEQFFSNEYTIITSNKVKSCIPTILHLCNVHYMSLFLEQRLMFSIVNYYFLTCVSASFFVFSWSIFSHFCPVTYYHKTKLTANFSDLLIPNNASRAFSRVFHLSTRTRSKWLSFVIFISSRKKCPTLLNFPQG